MQQEKGSLRDPKLQKISDISDAKMLETKYQEI